MRLWLRRLEDRAKSSSHHIFRDDKHIVFRLTSSAGTNTSLCIRICHSQNMYNYGPYHHSYHQYNNTTFIQLRISNLNVRNENIYDIYVFFPPHGLRRDDTLASSSCDAMKFSWLTLTRSEAVTTVTMRFSSRPTRFPTSSSSRSLASYWITNGKRTALIQRFSKQPHIHPFMHTFMHTFTHRRPSQGEESRSQTPPHSTSNILVTSLPMLSPELRHSA